MAENQDRSRDELTEEASPYRVEEFRRRGIVSQSREVTSLFVLGSTAMVLFMYAETMGAEISEFMQGVFKLDFSSKFDLAHGQIFHEILFKGLRVLLTTAFPVCVAGFVLGIVGSFIQVGSIFSTDPLTPDPDRINPFKGFQKFFSMRQVWDGVRLTFKMLTLLGISYLLIKSHVFKSPQSIFLGPLGILMSFGSSSKALFFSLMGVLIVFAAFDFGFQKWEFLKNIRMTKQEAKQELKEREGDPQIKARIRSIQKELARKRMMQAVKKADVVVTNPTHLAVALAYQKDKMKAPKVVAKGADFIAEKIKKIALEAGIPLVENVQLARTLYRSVKVGQWVPRALYQAIAEVLAYVYRLKNRKL